MEDRSDTKHVTCHEKIFTCQGWVEKPVVITPGNGEDCPDKYAYFGVPPDTPINLDCNKFEEARKTHQPCDPTNDFDCDGVPDDQDDYPLDRSRSYDPNRHSALKIEITLDDKLNIDTTPKMPEIKASAKVTPPGAEVTWSAQIKYKVPGASCSKKGSFDSEEVTGKGETFTPDFGGIFGGELTITAKATCGAKQATDTVTRTIGGETPTGEAVRNEIGALPPPFDPDDLKKIACHESGDPPPGQKQFNPDNKPVLGLGGDVGIMQICYMRTVGDFWNWKTNIADARPNLMDKLNYAKNFHNKVRHQVVRNMGPFPDATPLTPDELRLEAIKRYNAGTADPDVGYWEWDNETNTWIANPLGGGGGPTYVDQVLKQNANCRQP